MRHGLYHSSLCTPMILIRRVLCPAVRCSSHSLLQRRAAPCVHTAAVDSAGLPSARVSWMCRLARAGRDTSAARTVRRCSFSLVQTPVHRSISSASGSAALQSTLPAPSICAMHLNSPPPSELALRAEFNEWVADGPRCLSEALVKHHGKGTGHTRPTARVLEPSRVHEPVWLDEYATASRDEAEPRCYQWVHIPSQVEGRPDVVAVIFTLHEDLLRWRTSDERREWIKRGERFVTDRAKFVASQQPGGGESSVLERALEVQLQRDDGSLGGWLPHTNAESTGAQLPPPPSWKVAATVLVAMYPMQECNRLFILPALSGVPAWEALGPATQLWAVCAWTCGMTTVALLPTARRFTESIGFIGGAKGCPDARQLASRSIPFLLLAYGATIGLGAALVVALDREESDARPPIRRRAHKVAIATADCESAVS